MKVALLVPRSRPEVVDDSRDELARSLARELAARGDEPRLITSHPGRPATALEDGFEVVRNWRPPEGRLLRRNYLEGLTHAPFSYLTLRAGDDELAHAFHPSDAAAAGRWGRERRRPVVFSYFGVPDHAGLMRSRLKLQLTARAAAAADAVVADSEQAAAAFGRWLGVEARVIEPARTALYLELYSELRDR